jgi:choice-of-anchor A domain-containing protein
MTGGSVVGGVGIGSGNFNLTGGTINGAAEVAPGVTVTQAGGTVTGGIFTSQNAASAVSAAALASNTFAQLPATQIFGTISGTTTITLASGLNVIDLSGITLTGQTLTLQGPAGSEVILNDTGGMTLTSSQIVLTGGLLASDVVFNDTGAGGVTMTGGVLNGTILAPNATVSSGRINGEIFGGKGVTLTSGNIVGAPGPVIGAGLPAFAFLGGGFLLARRLRRRTEREQLAAPASP